MERLTLKQQAFVDYYLSEKNASEAIRKAGYSTKYPDKFSNILMKNPKIKTAIQERLKQIESDRIADAEEVLKFLTASMRGEIKEEVPDGQGGVFKKQLAARDRIKAAEMLAKRHQLFVEKIDVTAEVTPIIIEDVKDE